MNLWEKYNPGASLADAVAAYSGIRPETGEEKQLFALLKRHLTRRELRCFVMAESGAEIAACAEATGCEPDEALRLLDKARSKLRRPAFNKMLRELAQTQE